MENKETQRINELEDRLLDTLKVDILETKTSVLRIEKMLVGNGSEGLLQKVSSNQAKIKIILWVLSIIVSGALAGSGIIMVGNSNEVPKEMILND